MRRPAAATRPKPRISKAASFAAPVGGWIRNTALAQPGARLPDGSAVSGAFALENFFPTATGIKMRRGSASFAQIGDDSAAVAAMFAYINGNNAKLFAASSSAIYDVTSPAVPENVLLVDDQGNQIVDDAGHTIIGLPSVSAPVVGSLGSGAWSVAQFATPGGTFLRCVNGSDTPLVFNGTSFATTPAITGTAIDGVTALDPKSLSNVWVHQRRLFFVQKDTLNAWYLPADAIGGTAVPLPLGGVFTRGGALLFGAAWSLETGATSGLTEQCAFFSTEGEVAIYQGTDPGTAATWSKVGVYRIGKPLGPKAFIHAGGDLAIATDVGLVPLSQAVQRDFAALSPAAISYKIETAWNEAVADQPSGWTLEVWPTNQMVLVAPPQGSAATGQVFAANARTGGWGLFTGWNVTCLQLFGDRLFFGSANGMVIEANVTGTDRGSPFTSSYVPMFDMLKNPGALKTSLLMKAVLRSPTEIVPQLSLQSEYQVNLPAAPDAAPIASANVWGTAIWGVSTWGGEAVSATFGDWQSVGGSGYAIAPGLQITSGNIVPPDVEIVRIDWTYDQGDLGS